jgi:beta-N-acetylhexosaminidase
MKMDKNEQRQESQQNRREERHKRRQRSQIIAYTVVGIMILVLAAGIAFAVSKITGMSHNRQEQQNKLDDIIASEETITAPTTEPVETVPELTNEQKLDKIIDEAIIQNLPLEDKVAGLFITTPESITGVSAAVQAGDGTKDALSKYPVGGIVYAAKNIQSADQLKQMIDNTKLYTSYPLFIAIDGEGSGTDAVAAAGLGTKTDSPETIGASGDANNAYTAGTTVGSYLAELGFNLDFAPAADLKVVDGNAAGSSSYGTDAATVASFVTGMQTGLQEQKVTAAIGHFPGIGSTTQSTKNGMASTDRSAEDFRANEFAVFQSCIDSGETKMITVSNMAAPSLTGDNTPCSLSGAVVTDILRNELNFRGVIVSGAMNQAAITNYYGADEAAVLALRAGCDMIYAPENFETAYNGVLEAVQNGTISEERVNDSLRRIYRIKYADKIEQ